MNVRKRKLDRIRKGAKPRVLDLFAGCGGMSLGFFTEGFDIAGAVEFDAHAAASHSLNFFPDAKADVQELHAKPRDITAVEPDELVAELKLGRTESAIDVLIGGPPCQSYARVGRAKLREVLEHPEAFKIDPRGVLYLRFLHYALALRPLVILMENVPDVMNSGGHNVPEETCEALEQEGYRCSYTLLNAAYFGVPQMRERMFLLAYAEELATDVTFPSPTHYVQLPPGYEGSRSVALRHLRASKLFDDGEAFFTMPPSPSPSLPPAVTAKEAMKDLPRITLHLEGRLTRGARRFDSVIPYPVNGSLTDYARLMRHWPGFENETGIADHVIRSLPRDYRVFQRMNPGDQYPEAYQHAMNLYEEFVGTVERAGIRVSAVQRENVKKQFVPPYDVTKFPNKWRKMEADRPARTLMAHLGKDSYSHIHYDSDQARTISVREAARLQSFPDGFQFCGTMNPAFRQIGNAVPPLLSWAIARVIKQALGGVE